MSQDSAKYYEHPMKICKWLIYMDMQLSENIFGSNSCLDHLSSLQQMPEINSTNPLSKLEYSSQMGIMYHAPYDGVFRDLGGMNKTFVCALVWRRPGRDELCH